MDSCVELGLTRPGSPSNALVCSTPAQEQSGNSASGYDRTRSRKLNNEWQQTYVQHITKRGFTLRLYKLTLANTKLHIWREVCHSNSTPLSQLPFCYTHTSMTLITITGQLNSAAQAVYSRSRSVARSSQALLSVVCRLWRRWD